MAAPASGASGGPGGGEPPRTPVRYCAVYNCTNNYKTHPHLQYFTIPSTAKRCLKWLKKIRRMELLKKGSVSGYHRVCEDHFSEEEMILGGPRKRLKPYAVPTLRLPKGDNFITVREVVKQPAPAPAPAAAATTTPAPAPAPAPSRASRLRTFTTSELEIFEYIDVPRQRPEHRTTARRRTPAPVSTPPASLADFFTACDRHLNQKMADFVKTISQLQQQHCSGGNEGLDNLCVKLLAGAPEAYRLLQPALALPPPAALRRRAAPQLLHNDELADLIKMRVDRMTEAEKHCAISLDVIDVKPHMYYNITYDRIIGLHEIDGDQEPAPASHCAVLSARGLRGPWVQPAALCFLARLDSAALHAWVDSVITKLLAVGLKVCALVLDPTAPAAHRPNVNPSSPFFHVGEQKIYVSYDAPQLMKLLLCKFIKYDFYFEKTVARWSDVVQYRALEKHKPLTLTPQLTDAHVGAGAQRLASHMRPRRAARLLGRALAAALAGYHERGQLGASAAATVKLILKLNDLFDILDSTTKSTNLTEQSGQIAFLSYMKSFFKSLKLKNDSAVEVPDSGTFCEYWQISIATVLALSEDLASHDLRFAPRRLQRDERLTEALRRAAGARQGRPSCQRVFLVYRKQFFDDLLQPPGERAAVDLNSFLAQVSSISGTLQLSAEQFDIEEDVPVAMRDYRGKRGAQGDLLSVATWLLSAARRVHGSCEEGAEVPCGTPTASLLQLLRRLDAALAAALRTPQPARARLADLLLDLHVLDCELPCACFPLQYLKKLFLRLRLYQIMKQNRDAYKYCEGDVEFQVDIVKEEAVL